MATSSDRITSRLRDLGLGVDLVQVQLDGRPLAVPTDAGPSALPLRRADVGSVAPG